MAQPQNKGLRLCVFGGAARKNRAQYFFRVGYKAKELQENL